jgi:peptide/nickel transport system permease protein
MVEVLLLRVRRVAVTLLVLVTVVFIAVRLVPGNPALVILGDYATPELIASVEQDLGVDQPLWRQYLDFLRGLLTGDLGYSYRTRSTAASLVLAHIPYTIQLATAGFLLAVVPGVLAGLFAGRWHGSRRDLGIMGTATLAMSIPAFWLGLLLLFMFSLVLPWFPLAGGGDPSNPADIIRHLILPAVAVATREAAIISRVTRSAVLEVFGQDFITTAEAKGLRRNRVLRRHVVRNAILPVISISAIQLIALLSGSMVVEVVFSRPGLGSLFISAVTARDFPLIQACVIVFGLSVTLINFAADLSYSAADPRVRAA